MGLLDTRLVYAPFEYPQFYDYWLRANQSHWLHTEVSMSSDIQDWHFNLTPAEKRVVASILKGFVQSEVLIENYWSTKIPKWFKKPEIQMMASAFAAFESIHAAGYAYLQDTLGLDDYGAFMDEPSARNKIIRLLDAEDNKNDIALSLAVFSAFTEGVSLFSSFAVLFNFSRWNKMKGMSQIISWSIRDESLHSEAGCALFSQFIKEYPKANTVDLPQKLYKAANITVKLEDNFIENAFKDDEIQGINAYDLKQFIRQRTNIKLKALGMSPIYAVDRGSLKRMEWFDALSTGASQGDFFAIRQSDYAKGSVNFDNMWGN